MRARLPSAVVDTNLLVRGILQRRPTSAAVRLFRALRSRRFRLVTSNYILDELRRTLLAPEVAALADVRASEVAGLVDAVRSVAHVVRGRFRVEMVPTDARDNPIVACALEGSASYIVTDDRRDLLPLKDLRVAGYRVIRIVTPTAFLAAIGPGNQ